MGQTAGRYICPSDKVLHTTGTVQDGQMLRYPASKLDCDTRTPKMKCCPNTPARQVPRVINEYARDVARRLMRTKAFLKSRDERNGGLQYLTAGAGIPSVIPRSATLPYRPTAQSAKSSSSVPRLGNAKFR